MHALDVDTNRVRAKYGIARGAHPVLLINSTPYTDGEAGDWWRQVAQVADLVREDYYNARYLWNQGPVTAAEKELGMCFAPYGQRVRGIGLWGGSSERSNTGKLQLLARRWSLDPAAVPPEVWKLGWGITGEVSHSTLK